MEYDCIKNLAQAGHSVLFNTVPRACLVPGATLAQSCEFVNSCLARLGPDLSSWNAGELDQLTRLLWVNLFYQRLQQEPIRKPLLVRGSDCNLQVCCGDTRLMVLDLAGHTAPVSVITIVPTHEISNYAAWHLIHNNSQLITQLGFAPDAHVQIRIDQHDPWFEIGDHTTAGHMHDVESRTVLMQRYLDSVPLDFEFSSAWAQIPINWLSYQSCT